MFRIITPNFNSSVSEQISISQNAFDMREFDFKEVMIDFINNWMERKAFCSINRHNSINCSFWQDSSSFINLDLMFLRTCSMRIHQVSECFIYLTLCNDFGEVLIIFMFQNVIKEFQEFVDILR